MERLNTREFSSVVSEFVKHNDLVDSVAKSGTTFNRVVSIVADSLKEQGYQFTDNCNNFILSIKREHNKVMTKLGHDKRLRSMV